jgi:hypothetical protein
MDQEDSSEERIGIRDPKHTVLRSFSFSIFYNAALRYCPYLVGIIRLCPRLACLRYLTT